MIALDSNVFIYHLGEHPDFGTYAKELLKAVEDGQLTAITSELTFTEVLGYPGMSDEQAIIAEREIKKTNVKLNKVNADTLLLAASLRRKYNIRTPDAIHIASAIRASATQFISNDRKLLSKKIPEIEFVALANIKEAILFPGDLKRSAP